MRRLAELSLVAVTALILVATSQARQPCANDTVNLRAQTTCGPVANLEVTSRSNCAITTTGADFGGLPSFGSVRDGIADAGVLSGFFLAGAGPDGGAVRNCTVLPADGGM